MNKNIVGLMGCAAALFAVAGCTPEARQDVGDAGDKMGQAADKSAKGTADAVDKAAAKTGEAVKDTAVATKDAAKDAAQTTEKAVAKTGEAVADATKDAAQATEKAAAKTGEAVKDAAVATKDAAKDAAQNTEKAVAKTGAAVAKAGDTLKLTPKVKNAILVDDSVKIDLLDVDTVADTKTVTLNGTAQTADMKKKAEADAKKALADAKADYKVVNNLKVGPAK